MIERTGYPEECFQNVYFYLEHEWTGLEGDTMTHIRIWSTTKFRELSRYDIGSKIILHLPHCIVSDFVYLYSLFF